MTTRAGFAAGTAASFASIGIITPVRAAQFVARELDAAALQERRDTAIQSGSIKRKLAGNGYYTRWKSEFGERAWATLEEHTGKFA